MTAIKIKLKIRNGKEGGKNMIDVLRREIKYKVSAEAASRIKCRLSNVLSGDVHNTNEGYIVRSLYFDTPANVDYYDKAAGVDYRKKIRLRIYNANADNAKLELKEKQNIFQRKRSLIVTRAEAEALISGQYECLREKGEFGSYIYALMNTECYRPSCVVQYVRQAYVSDTNDIRITFDRRLSANEGNFNIFDRCLQLYPVWLSENTIMEVKYNHFLLSYIKNMIDEADKLHVSSSKYCQCRMFGLGGEMYE